MLRTALLYLVVGSGVGAWRLAALGGQLPAAPYLGTLHRHLVFQGWLAQFALGTAYWILPRYVSGRPRGRPGLAWLGFAALNAGLALSALRSVAPVVGTIPAVVDRALYALGIGCLVWMLWPRVRAFGAG